MRKILNFYKVLDKADAWAESGGMYDWLASHVPHIILGLFVIAVILALIINWIDNGKGKD